MLYLAHMSSPRLGASKWCRWQNLQSVPHSHLLLLPPTGPPMWWGGTEWEIWHPTLLGDWGDCLGSTSRQASPASTIDSSDLCPRFRFSHLNLASRESQDCMPTSCVPKPPFPCRLVVFWVLFWRGKDHWALIPLCPKTWLLSTAGPNTVTPYQITKSSQAFYTLFV